MKHLHIKREKDPTKTFIGGLVIGSILGLLVGFSFGTMYAERVLTGLL